MSSENPPSPNDLSRAGYFDVDADEAVAGTTAYWSYSAGEYLEEFGPFLGDVQFRWCPEGLLESDAELLGPLSELRTQKLLEVGAGAGQCSRWLRSNGIDARATDIAAGMVAAGERINAETGIDVPMSVADARSLPFEDEAFDQVFTAFGAIPFVKDAAQVHREVFRVLRPGGAWTFATTHPFRWCFPDDPTNVTVNRSYFDRTPYAEVSGTGTYAEFHRTMGDHVAEIIGSGFHIVAMIEPEWVETNTHEWGAWSPERGRLLPGTVIFRARRPG